MAIVGIATNSLIIAVEQYILIIGMVGNSGVITLVWPTKIFLFFLFFLFAFSFFYVILLLSGKYPTVARWPIGRDPS